MSIPDSSVPEGITLILEMEDGASDPGPRPCGDRPSVVSATEPQTRDPDLANVST